MFKINKLFNQQLFLTHLGDDFAHVTLMEATVECSLGQSRWKPSSVLNHLDFFSPASYWPNVTSPPAITSNSWEDWLFIPYQHIRTKTNLRKLVTEEMLQLDGHNSIIIVDGANMIGWPEKMIDDELEIVRNAGVVQLQREIPHSINIQVAKVGGGCVAGCEESSCAGHLTWKESIPQSLMSYWIQLTSCNIMKLSSVA
ncbi:hypothetical protein Bca52824_046049 [Brassica carinata]|uniref:Uncharacterized protein n=1 Tax=Brassica carinata TaxID=52824 RepID=A0A8X7RDP0_BRACI|nr:hypothetical protein Bca52824_046049 [Brassica carinata]